MYYEKLMSIYQSSLNKDELNSVLVRQFSDYLTSKSRQLGNILSPYEFMLSSGMSLDEALYIFMFFSDEDGCLYPNYFVECFSSGCTSEKMYIDMEILEADLDPDTIIECVECGTEYAFEEILDYIKVYFKIKPDCFVPYVDVPIEKKDKHSTIQALRGMRGNLKSESLSPSVEDERDGAIKLTDLDRVNRSRRTPASRLIEGHSTRTATFLRG